MAMVENINCYRLRKAREKLPSAASDNCRESITSWDSRLNSALGLVLEDPKLSRDTKIYELKQTLKLYERLTQNLQAF